MAQVKLLQILHMSSILREKIANRDFEMELSFVPVSNNVIYNYVKQL